MEKNNGISEVLKTTVEKIKDLIGTQMVVGEPVSIPDGITLIPVSRVLFGFASGGSEFGGKKADEKKNFGGGAGAGVKVEPVAFLVVKGESVRVVNVNQPAAIDAIERAVDLAPELIDKCVALFKKKDKEEE